VENLNNTPESFSSKKGKKKRMKNFELRIMNVEFIILLSIDN